jgi:uncharacterized protein YjbJ (UPF0337 family)
MRHLFKVLFPIAMAVAPGDGGGGGDGAGNDHWAVTLPESVRSWDEVKNSETPEKFWDQITHMRTHLGQSVRIPSSDAGAEDWAKFNKKILDKVPTLMPKPNPDDKENLANVYSALGKPDAPEGYKVPEGAKTVAEDAVKALRDLAYSLHLNNAQFEALVTDVEKHNEENRTLVEEHQEQAQGVLKKEWGAAFDQNYTAIEKYLENTGAPSDLIAKAKDKKLQAETAVWVLKQWDAVKGEGPGALGDSSTGDVMTPSEAKERIGEIMGNSKHPYHNMHDPAHSVALERMVKLHKLARGVM